MADTRLTDFAQGFAGSLFSSCLAGSLSSYLKGTETLPRFSLWWPHFLSNQAARQYQKRKKYTLLYKCCFTSSGIKVHKQLQMTLGLLHICNIHIKSWRPVGRPNAALFVHPTVCEAHCGCGLVFQSSIPRLAVNKRHRGSYLTPLCSLKHHKLSLLS